MSTVEHQPSGDPCLLCGKLARSHRILHKFHAALGDPLECRRCGCREAVHPKPERLERPWRSQAGRHKTRPKIPSSKQKCFIGIDGEGQGGKGETHRYVLLAARRENGQEEWFVEAPPGGSLSTTQCLDMILELQSNAAKVFSYAFGYDLTKILADLPDEDLYLLFRPELRQRYGEEAKKGPFPVKWRGYNLNLQGTKFSVSKGWGKGKKRVVIWDLFKFFQAKFVSALTDWKVGTPALWRRMSEMKDKRGSATLWSEQSAKALRDYCLEECECIAVLAHKLIEAHEDAILPGDDEGLKLRSYYGAGSSGAAMLDKMGIKAAIVKTPLAMKSAVASAFFGGRFENSVIGPVKGPLWNYDISSAYPYSTTFLPCLLHGKWTRTKRRRDIEKAQAALVRYTLGQNPGITSWGPFPFRDNDGNICFPIESGGGWVWRDEYVAGERIFPHVEFCEAFVYHTRCSCQPFAQLPEYYMHRLRIGKEGPGIVIKLAVNSVYGKLAQSVGNALFNSWIWAGMITSGTRAQMLEMLALHKNWANLLFMATDGIYTRERLVTPLPRNTGTSEPVNGVSKPLGGWEETKAAKGVFIARPGIYFPLNPTEEELKKIRARGVGRGVVLKHWKAIVETWEMKGIRGVAHVDDVGRFCGAKSSVLKAPKGYQRAERGRRGPDGHELPAYGEWISRPVEVSFDPLPKRAGLNPDGLTLALRKFPRGVESVAYDKAMKGEEGVLLGDMQREIEEQPDGDYVEFV